MKIIIYTDGGADPNPGIGGWAAVLLSGKHEKRISGNAPRATNNRMELTAAIEALRTLKRPSTITLHTDSQYLRRGITEWIDGWKKKGWRNSQGKPIKNADLWKALHPLTIRHQIEWVWVKGHSGNEWNEVVDRMARQARLDITPADIDDEHVPKLYTRCSCKGNPGPGGWGAVLKTADNNDGEMSGHAARTTNNRMELTAVIEGLLLVPAGGDVQVYTTSDYLFQGAVKWINGWRKRGWIKKDGKPVANRDLWKALDQLKKEYAIKWINAKGQTHTGLDEAAILAVTASKKQ